MSETMPGAAGTPCKMSEVPIGAHVRVSFISPWQQVADVVRIRDGSGNIRLTFANGDQFIGSPNKSVEIRADVEDVPADLMRAAELAAYEALKEDHREPTALWHALVRYAVAAVLPLHERHLRDRIADAIYDADDACGGNPCDCCRAQRDVSAAIARGDGSGADRQQGH